MSSIVRNFLLGTVIGILTVMMLFLMFTSVVVSVDEINLTAMLIIIVSYGAVTALLAEFFNYTPAGKTKKK